MNRIHWHVDNALAQVRAAVVWLALVLSALAGCAIGGVAL